MRTNVHRATHDGKRAHQTIVVLPRAFKCPVDLSSPSPGGGGTASLSDQGKAQAQALGAGPSGGGAASDLEDNQLGATFVAFPLLQLTTFIREWSAVQCIRSIPLGSYIISGSPGISPAKLRVFLTRYV